MRYASEPSKTGMNITNVLTDSLKELECSGILCAVSHGNALSTFSAGKISPQDHSKSFYIYSITKTFTATAVLLLFEDKGLSLDRSFTSFFPSTAIPSSVSIRQLLNHTGGLSDYFSSAEYQQAVREHPDKPWPYDRLMKVGLAGTPLFEPGSGWSYSNPGYALLNELIEQLSGMNFHAYLKQFIFDPLKLTDTKPFLKPDYAGQLLEAEEPSIEGDFRKRYSPGWIAPGCLISTITDIVLFYHALFSGKLLSSLALEQMKEAVDVPVPLPEPLKAAYGLGVMHVRNDPLGNAYSHGGGGPGYTTYATCYPAVYGAPFSICFVINRNLPTTPIALADKIARSFVGSQPRDNRQ
jgi:D-alanyl-D-alanine carboxypeptidase